MKFSKLFLAPILCLALLTGGCNGQSLATKAQAAISAALTIAQVEESVVPVQDQKIYTNFVNLGITLDTQLGTCITNVSGIMGKSAKFLSCFNTFAQGLLSPTELAELRILSGPTQNKVELYISAVVAGVNTAVAFFGGTNIPVPTVGAPPTAAQLQPVLNSMRTAAGI